MFKRSKYGARKITIINEEGEAKKSDSVFEARVSQFFHDKKEELGIDKIEEQVLIEIHEGYSIKNYVELKKKKLPEKIGNRKWDYSIEIKDKKVLPIYYKADFILTGYNGKVLYIDAKGFETPDFKLKKKMFEKKYNVSLILFNEMVCKLGKAEIFLKDQFKIN